MKLTPPTEKTHPDLPFWKLGYTPEQVYDEFFPEGFRFICNSERPAVCGRFGNGEQRLWRFEFVVKPDEDPMQMASREKTMEMILPYLTLPGSKYGSAIARNQFDVKFEANLLEQIHLGGSISPQLH